MSWVRYDDGFDSHPKVTAVVSEDPGAIALHALANTWSSRQKRPGFVPVHQAGVLVGKARGKRWAALLEKHGLWDAVEGGWEFHDHGEYRESAKRSTAGTPAELSEKRRAAGRKGGKAAQQKRANGKQPSQQTGQGGGEANGVAVSPVVEPSYEASTPGPVPTSSGVARIEQTPSLTDTQRSKRITDGYSARVPLSNWTAVNALVLRGIRSGLYADQELCDALWRLADENRPVTADSLRIAIEGMGRAAHPGSSNMDDHAALIRRLDNGHNQGEIA